MLVEKVGVVDEAGTRGVWRLGKVNDGPVREFGILKGVGAVVGFAEREAGVEDSVAVNRNSAAQRGTVCRDLARKNQRRHETVTIKRLLAERPAAVFERDRRFSN